jgi:hypothetical protein
MPAAVIVVAALAITGLQAAAPTPSTARWITFRHAEYGFSISHPPSWDVLSGRGRAAFAAVGPEPAGVPDFRLNVVVATGRVPQGATLEEADAEIEQMLSRQNETVRVLRKDRIDLRGIPSFIVYVARTNSTGYGLYQMVLIVAYRARGYAVVGTTAAGSARLAEETRLLQSIVLTFQPH